MDHEVDELFLLKICRFIKSRNNKSTRRTICQVYLPSIWLLSSFTNPAEATDLDDDDYEDPEARKRLKRALIIITLYTALTLSFVICIYLRRKMHRKRDEAAAAAVTAAASQSDEHGSTRTATRKLDLRLLESFPETSFPQSDAKFDFTDCHICLEEFKQGESLVVLPTCGHSYHKGCIHRWMATRNSFCPDCRHDYGFV